MSVMNPGGVFFLGVGAEKAGTSWMHRRLTEHPHVWTPPHKEIHYFDAVHADAGPFYRRQKYQALREAIGQNDWDVLAKNPRRLARLQWLARQALIGDLTDEWYVSLFEPGAGEYPAIGEVTPGYSMLPEEGWEHVVSIDPEVRIVFLMREPVARLWSALRYFAGNHPESAIMETPDRMVRFATRPANVSKTRYDVTLDYLDRFFPPEHVLVAFYEEIFASEDAQIAFLRALCDLLEIDFGAAEFGDLARAVNASAPKPIPEEFRSEMRSITDPVVEAVEATVGHVPPDWKAG